MGDVRGGGERGVRGVADGAERSDAIRQKRVPLWRVLACFSVFWGRGWHGAAGDCVMRACDWLVGLEGGRRIEVEGRGQRRRR